MFANLFSRKQYRQLELIDYVLNQPEEFASFAELQKKFDITERVLRRDLREIQALCDYQLEINIVQELVSIKFNKIASYNEVLRMFARDTITFNLLDDIIFHRFENVTDLFDQYYISRSTGYRYLNKLNDFFESQHIEVEISTNPLTLVGNELAVRALIPHFLTMYYHVDECPFQTFNMQKIHQIYRALASRFTYLEIFSNDRTFHYNIASNIDRTLQGHRVPANQWQLDSSYWTINHPEQNYSADNFFDLLNQLSPSFLKDTRQVMFQFFLPFNNGKNVFEQNLILFYLISYWPDLIMQLRKHPHKPNILVFLENVAAGRQFQHFLQSTNMIDANVQLVTNPIECHECAMQDWDIVISDYELRQMRCRFFVGVDGIPTNAHVIQINQLIKLLRSSDNQRVVEESLN